MKLKPEVKEILTDARYLGDLAEVIDPLKNAQTLRQVVMDLKKTMRSNPDIKALSAPAIGYPYRVFCIKFEDLEIKTFVNPIITEAKGITLTKETCWCIPGKKFIRPRNNDIKVMFTDPSGKMNSRQLVGMAAYVFQHEIDHLDGILLSDVGLEIDEDFEMAPEEEQEEIMAMYLDSIDLQAKEIHKRIDDDPDVKELKEAAEFLTALQTGKVTLEKTELDKETVDRINQAKREVREELEKEKIDGIS